MLLCDSPWSKREKAGIGTKQVPGMEKKGETNESTEIDRQLGQ
jgi:hypothetical protein